MSKLMHLNSNVCGGYLEYTAGEGISIEDGVISCTGGGGGGSTSKYYPVTITSASNDTVYYINEDSQQIILCETNSSGQGAGVIIAKPSTTEITLYSTVAKDTTDVDNHFSKTFQLSDDLDSVILMPDGKIIYWYGVVCEPLDYGVVYSTDTNWSKATNWTFNTNNIVSPTIATPSTYNTGKYAGIGTTNTISLSEYSNARYTYSKSSDGIIINESSDISSLSQNAYITTCQGKDSYGNTYLWNWLATSKNPINKTRIGGGGYNATGATVYTTMYAIWLE